MANPNVTHPDWEPCFADYLYLSFTNATAFSPTDTMPLTRWAKMTMLLQSTIALVTIALSSPASSTSSAPDNVGPQDARSGRPWSCDTFNPLDSGVTLRPSRVSVLPFIAVTALLLAGCT